MATSIGTHTLRLDNAPSIAAFASVVSRKESEGPLARYFDVIMDDSSFGERTWEKAESALQKAAVAKVLEKGSMSPKEINFHFAGDLLNQCIGSTYGLRELGIPFFGLFGACSTMAESLILASLFIEGGFATHCLASTSSHFCSAERQFRFPLEYGGQRPPSAQWTVTGAGACITAPRGLPPYVLAVTAGTIEDLGIKDANNMGAAMAPAAHATLKHFFDDTGTTPEDFDLILTGDLGLVGSSLLENMMEDDGYPIARNHKDCGLLIYDREKQDVHAGGSGCGCAASVLCGYILPQLLHGTLSNVLFIATGALMSPTSVQQGESIPGIAHLLHLSHFPSFDRREQK